MDNIEPTFVDKLMGNDAPANPAEGMIGKEQCMEWADTLRKYKSGKTLLENRMRSNQEYWRGKQWQQMGRSNPEQPQPRSAWLTNVILSKHAARMDAYPEATILARELNDEAEAKLLTQIIPNILDMCEFKRTYSQVGWDKDISCAGAYCITWDASKHNGLGDIDIAPLDLMNLYWEPGVTDIQQSKYVFVVKLIDTKTLEEQYPDKVTEAKTAAKVIEPSKYVYEDNIDTSDKDCVIDVYYKKFVNGKQTLQFAKFVRDIVLFATENDPQLAVTGLYDHGMYPFVIEPLYPVKGSICGFGYVDICRDPQDFIDIIGNSIVKNVLENTTPRYFIRSDAKVNMQQFSNLNERVVECSGNLGEDSIRPFEQTALPSGALNFYQAKIDEMKQTAGNRDASSGGTEHGVTAASALAVMQEAGNALSRDENQIAYEAFKDIIAFVIELIRQFYDLPRFFRIGGERGAYQYITYTNARIKEQMTIGIDGAQFFRKPEFDLEITAAKAGEYSRQQQNQLALEFYQVGFFDPMNAAATMQCLDMMDFRGKDKVAANVQQSLMMLQAMAAQNAQAASESGSESVANGGSTFSEKNPTESNAAAAHNRGEKTLAKARDKMQGGSQP